VIRFSFKNIFSLSTSNALWDIFFQKEFGLYFVFALLATVVDWGLVFLLTSVFDVWYIISVIAGYIGGLLSAYFFHRIYTFKNSYRRVGLQFFLFWAVATIGLGFTSMIVLVFVEVFHIWYMSARMIATGVVFFWNFIGHKFISFRRD